jgi:transcriptional antiterminator RfaH
MNQISKIKIEEKSQELGQDSHRWFVLTTQWRQEKLALENLQRQRFDAYLPMHLKEVRPHGQPARVVSLPLFPRYLFCQVDLGVAGWRSIYSTRGVQGVLPCEAHGSKILARLIADIQAREVRGLVELTPAELPCSWKTGDRVSYGSFRDAIFCERVDERRCTILVSLLGRDSRQIVDLADLE